MTEGPMSSRMLRVPLLLLLVHALPSRPAFAAPEEAAAPSSQPAPTLEQRLARLEAYVSSSAPTVGPYGSHGAIDAGRVTATASLTGHQGWKMVSAAVVSFLILPGLFLFYEGLVRRNLLPARRRSRILAVVRGSDERELARGSATGSRLAGWRSVPRSTLRRL
jgi:hypothetical protein